MGSVAAMHTGSVAGGFAAVKGCATILAGGDVGARRRRHGAEEGARVWRKDSGG